MLSRRRGRLSRFRKINAAYVSARQRIFQNRMMPEAMDKPRVVVLTGRDLCASPVFEPSVLRTGCGEHRVEDVATPEGFARDPDLVGILQCPPSSASAARNSA